MGELICVCDKAFEGCDKKCPKGRLFEPSQVFHCRTWPQIIFFEYAKKLRNKMERELKEELK